MRTEPKSSFSTISKDFKMIASDKPFLRADFFVTIRPNETSSNLVY